MTKTELIVGVFIALLTIAVALFLAYSADNKGYVSDEEWERRMGLCMKRMYKKAHEMGGKVSGEHGIGFAKKPYLVESTDPTTLELMRGIKAVFDPKNILNPGKIF